MGYIREERPFLGKGRTVYRINDNFFAFWFRFVFPRRDGIEIGFDVVEEIRDEFNDYPGFVFEDIARQFLIGSIRLANCPLSSQKLGAGGTRTRRSTSLLWMRGRKKPSSSR